jgi:HK97 family phage major capsid protein
MLYASLIDRAAEENGFSKFIRTGETRQLGYGADDSGSVIAPRSFADKVSMRMKESWIRKYATVVKCTRSFQAAWINTEPTVGVRTPAASTGVLAMGTESAPTVALPTFATGGTPSTELRELKPRFMTVSTYVSRELLEDSASGASVEDFLAMAFARKLAEEEHKQAIIGTGTNQYLGMRTAVSDASRTVQAAAANTLTLSDFQEAIESVGIGVYENACWILSHYAYRVLAGYATSAPLGSGSFQTHIVDGKPIFTLFGRPAHLTDHLVLTTKSGGFSVPASTDHSVGLVDLSQYLIAETSEFRVERYDEWDNGTLGATKGQVMFLGRMRTDGALLDPRNATFIKHP